MSGSSENGAQHPNANEQLTRPVQHGGEVFYRTPEGGSFQQVVESRAPGHYPPGHEAPLRHQQHGQQPWSQQQPPTMPQHQFAAPQPMQQQPQYMAPEVYQQQQYIAPQMHNQPMYTAQPTLLQQQQYTGSFMPPPNVVSGQGQWSLNASPQVMQQQAMMPQWVGTVAQQAQSQYYGGYAPNMTTQPPPGFGPKPQVNAMPGATSQQPNVQERQIRNEKTRGKSQKSTDQHQGKPHEQSGSGKQKATTRPDEPPKAVRILKKHRLKLLPGDKLIFEDSVTLMTEFGPFRVPASSDHPVSLVNSANVPSDNNFFTSYHELKPKLDALFERVNDGTSSGSDDVRSQHKVVQVAGSTETLVSTSSSGPSTSSTRVEPVVFFKAPPPKPKETDKVKEREAVQEEDQNPDVDINQPTVQEEVVPDQEILDEPILEETVHMTQSTIENRPVEEQTLQQQPISEEANQEEVVQDQPNLGEPIPKEPTHTTQSSVEDGPIEEQTLQQQPIPEVVNQEEVAQDQPNLGKPIPKEPIHTTQSTIKDRQIEEQTLQQQPNSEEANQEEVAQDQPNLGKPIPKELPVSPVEDYPMEDHFPTQQVLTSPFKKPAKTYKNAKRALKKAQRIAQKQIEQSNELALQGSSSQSTALSRLHAEVSLKQQSPGKDFDVEENESPAEQATDSTVSISGRKRKSSDEDEVEEANDPESPEKVAKRTKAERKAEKDALKSAELAEIDDDVAEAKRNRDCDSLFQKYIELHTWLRDSREVYEIQLAGVQLNEFEQGLWKYHYNHYKTEWKSKKESVKSDLTKKKKEACRGTTDESRDIFRKYSVLLMNLNAIVIQDVVAIKTLYPEEWEQKLDKEYLSSVFKDSRAEFNLNNLNKTIEINGEDPQWMSFAVTIKMKKYLERQSAIRLGTSLENVRFRHGLDRWLNEEYFKMKEDPRESYMSSDRELLIKNYTSYWEKKLEYLENCFVDTKITPKLKLRTTLVENLSLQDLTSPLNEPLLYDTYQLIRLDQRSRERTASEDPMRHVKNYLHLVYSLPQ